MPQLDARTSQSSRKLLQANFSCQSAMAYLNANAFLLVVLFGACAMAQTLNQVRVTDCGNAAAGRLMEVRISDCPSLPCLLRKGTKATIEMDFVPSGSTSRVTTGATGKLGAVPLPFVGTNGTPACPKIFAKNTRKTVGCNLNANEPYTYSNSFNILQIYPTTNVQVQWELIDGATRQKIACFQVPAKIV